MREILFKAKRVKDGEWIEGYLFDNGFDGEEKKYFIGGLIIEKYNGTACDEWVITGIDFARLTQKPSASSQDFMYQMQILDSTVCCQISATDYPYQVCHQSSANWTSAESSP